MATLTERLSPTPLTWRVVRQRLQDAAQPWWLAPLGIGLLSRAAVVLFGFIAAALIPPTSEPAFAYHTFPNHLFLDTWASRWDTGFYLSIVQEGYVYPATPFSSIAFFPLYPLLIKALTLTGLSAAWAGILLSQLCFLLALCLFYRLARLDEDHATAQRAVGYLAFFPMALFFSAVYTESLFLLLTVGSLYAARRGQWRLASLLGALTTATRLVGIVLLPVLVLEWWQRAGRRGRATRNGERGDEKGGRRWLDLAWLGLVPGGLLAYMVFLWQRFGDPLAFQRASAAWGRDARPFWFAIGDLIQQTPWRADVLLGGAFPVQRWLDLGCVLLFLSLGAWLLWRGRPSYGLFVFLGALVPSSSGILMSMPRYMMVLFPAFLLLARAGRRPWLDRLLTAIFGIGLGLYVTLWANWFWVA